MGILNSKNLTFMYWFMLNVMGLAHSLYYFVIMLLFPSINKHPYVYFTQGISILYLFSLILIV